MVGNSLIRKRYARLSANSYPNAKRFKANVVLPRSLATRVRSLLRNVEVKELPLNTGPSAGFFTAAGTVSALNLVAQGAGDNQRVGQHIKSDSIWISVNVELSDATATTSLPITFYGMVRVMLVWDKQTNGALPAVTDILTNATATSDLNHIHRDRFTIIYDQVRSMANSSASAGSNMSTHFTCRKKISRDVEFQTTAGNIGAIATGGLYMLCISTQSAGGGPVPLTFFDTNYKYTDL